MSEETRIILVNSVSLSEYITITNDFRKLEEEIEYLKKLNNANYQSFIEVNNIINELKEWFKGYHKSYASCKWYEEDYIEFIEHLENELKGNTNEKDK